MTLEIEVASLVTATTDLTNAVNIKKAALTIAVNAATTSEINAAASESVAASLKTQTQTARDEAIAGLGAADQSLNLVHLAYGLAGAIDLAGQAVKDAANNRTFRTQTGDVVVTQAASTQHSRTYASVAVTLAKPFRDTGYRVEVECLAATPFMGCQGDVQVLSRATNGFVLAITGSASSATLRWSVSHPNAK